MYVFVGIEKITYFLNRFSIDVSLFSNFELSIVVLLANIFVLLSYIFLGYISYRLILFVKGWWD